MYVNQNYKTKKAVKDAIAEGKNVGVFCNSPYESVPENGTVFLEGPHAPEHHTWYAQGTIRDGKLVKVT